MRPTDAEQQIRDLAAQLNTRVALARMREYEKGGLPGQSMSDGRGGDSPCPVAVTPATEDWRPRKEGEPLRGNAGRVLGVADPTDRQVRAERLQLEQGLRHAALALADVVRITNAWTIPRIDDTTKAEKLGEQSGVPCANVACDRWMTGTQDNRPRHIDGVALCERCYRYTRRTQKSWSPQREAAEAS